MPKIDIMGRKVDYKPYTTEMYLVKLKARLELEPSFINTFKVDLTNSFIREHLDIVNPNHQFTQNTVWSVSGLTGTGKSMCILSLVKLLVPKERFSYKNICFFDSQILELAKEIPQNTFIIRDEGVGKAVFGIGSRRQTENLNVLVETCRKYGLSVVFIEPEEKEYDIAKYYLETVDMDFKNRVTRMAIKDPRTMTYIGAIYVPIVAETDEDWVKYNEVKDEFITMMRKGEYKDSKNDFRALAVEVADKIDTEIYFTKKQRLAYLQANFPNFTSGEITIIHTFLEIVITHGEDALYESI